MTAEETERRRQRVCIDRDRTSDMPAPGGFLRTDDAISAVIADPLSCGTKKQTTITHNNGK